jgi:hypothetical protein
VPTNRDRLQRTLQHAHEVWRAEQSRQRKNAVNESTWTVEVIEPVLAALDWPRLRQGDLGGSGAYYEWPTKNNVDVALILGGEAAAYAELKQTLAGCTADLRKKLAKHPELGAVRWAVAGWFDGDAGFCLFALNHAGELEERHRVTLASVSRKPELLACFAAPVLRGDVASADAWLQLNCPQADPIVPRFMLRDVQARFFQVLQKKLGIPTPLETRFRLNDFDPPMPTYAYTELPGVLPDGWGIVFDIDPTVNDINCFFYERSPQKVDEAGRWSIDSGKIERHVEAFIDRRVLPKIEERRRLAEKSGLIA